MLPVLGEHSFSSIKLSVEEEEIAAALRRQSSTGLSGWPSLFVHRKEISVRRAAFVLYCLCKCLFGNSLNYSINTTYIPLPIKISTGHCFPLAPLFLGHLYSQLDLLHDCEIEGDSCYILFTAFNTTVLQTFFWEHSVNYLFVVKDKTATWSKFSDLPQGFLDRFPDFQDNLPLVYRWVGLKTCDYDLVDALDYEENVLFRTYGDDYLGFACISVFSRFYQPTSLIHDLRADEYRSLAYLSTVSKVFYWFYLPWVSPSYLTVHRECRSSLDLIIPVGPQEIATCLSDLTPFIKSRAFACWKGEVSRIMVPSSHRFGFNTSSMDAYWQRLTQSMVEFINASRSEKTPIFVHRKPLVSNPGLAPPVNPPYLMSIVKSLGLLNRMRSEVVGSHTPYIYRKVGVVLLMLWRITSLCLPNVAKEGREMLPWT